MLFNSLTFFIFFAIVYPLYLATQKNLRLQNYLLLISSFIFYGWWDWRFLFLMLFSISVDYVVAQWVYDCREPKKKKLLLSLSLLVNLGILGFFKYFNFFVGSLESILRTFGISVSFPFWNIVLPVGVSFYTFQAMSYVIDVYRGNLIPAKSFFEYATFVCYFPQLVAGPIERASHLLPQVQSPRVLVPEKVKEGCHLVVWGLFKKMVIADNLARIVETVFDLTPPYNGVGVLIAVYAFAFQIYCDFSGYSDIARGLGRLMGFDIMLNFNLPYFSQSPSEFWQRWHISLSTWLKDYLYIPLGGNRKGEIKTYRNLAFTMLLGGLWHGANWTFVVWGAYHGFLLMLHRVVKNRSVNVIPDGRRPIRNLQFQEPMDSRLKHAGMTTLKKSKIAALWSVIKVFLMFHLVCLGWLFFRAKSMTQVKEMLTALFLNFGYDPAVENMILQFVFLAGFLTLIQIYQYRKKDLMAIYHAPLAGRLLFYGVLAGLFLLMGDTQKKEFIYFQF